MKVDRNQIIVPGSRVTSVSSPSTRDFPGEMIVSRRPIVFPIRLIQQISGAILIRTPPVLTLFFFFFLCKVQTHESIDIYLYIYLLSNAGARRGISFIPAHRTVIHCGAVRRAWHYKSDHRGIFWPGFTVH